MSEDIKRLPPTTVPAALHKLILLYALEFNGSKGKAIRQALIDSPALRQLAIEKGIDIDSLPMPEHGGNRHKEE